MFLCRTTRIILKFPQNSLLIWSPDNSQRTAGIFNDLMENTMQKFVTDSINAYDIEFMD